MRSLLLLTLFSTLLVAAPRAQQPATAEEFYERGMERLRREEVDGALADFDKAIALRADFADAYFARSLAWDMKERGAKFPELVKARDASMADLDKAIALAPERLLFLKRRGAYMLRFAAGPEDYEAIIADFSKAISLDPSDAQLYFLRSSVLMLREDFKGALEDDDRAVALEPANAGYVGSRGWLKLVFLGDYKGAEADADRAIRLDTSSDAYQWYAIRGRARLSLGRKLEATRDFRKCRQLDSRCASALQKLDMLMKKAQRR